MTRVFLKLYLFLVLPLILMTMLPQSPLGMLGEWWFEKQIYRQYGAIYPLIKEELDQIPKSQWEKKVESISTHFAYPLVLKKRSEVVLSDKTQDKLNDPEKRYAVTEYNRNNTLIFPVEGSDYLLLASLHSRVTRLEEFEKDTRGFRYFLNKKIKSSKDPVKEFNAIAKKYFNLDLNIYSLKDFKALHSQHDNKKLLSNILESELYVDYKKSNLAYILTEDKKFIVTITNVNQKATYKRYYKLLSFIVPALLLALGALIWMALFKSEFRKVNKAAKQFGDGKLDTRIHLSKNSALHPIADSFNDMAIRIQHLISGQRDLTNAVSHEFKTPLSRLHYALELQKSSESKQDRDQYTQKIEDNIANLESLVDELLTYTRLETTKTLTVTKQDLSQWLQNEIHLFQEYHPDIKIELNHSQISNNPQVEFDSSLLSRALSNIIDNAIHHAHNADTFISVTVTKQKTKTVIIIEDNGSGIDQTDYKKIFKPFTRLDASRQRHKHNNNTNLGGYGIGLSIVKSIMQQHGGDVVCSKSNLGGAQFTLSW